MNLKQLQHALCVAEEGAFGRAAEKLHITQSALSRSIQALEADIALVLFDRGTTGVQATVEGAQFLQQAQVLLRQANSLKRDAELMAGAKVGALRFGCGPVAMELVLPKVLPQLVAEQPRLDIQLSVLPAVQLLDNLLAEKLEFFLADDQQIKGHPSLESIPLFSLSIGFYVRAGHPLLQQSTLSIDDLLAYTLASPSFFNQDNKTAHKHLSPILEHQWLGHLRCEYLPVLLATTLASDAILLTAKSTVSDAYASGQLRELRLRGEYATMASNLKLIKLSGRRLSPVAKLLLAKIQSDAVTV